MHSLPSAAWSSACARGLSLAASAGHVAGPSMQILLLATFCWVTVRMWWFTVLASLLASKVDVHSTDTDGDGALTFAICDAQHEAVS